MTERPSVWHVGGEDVHMRIPMLHRVAEAGFDVAAVGSRGERAFADAGIPFHRYPLARGMSVAADVASVRGLRRLLREHRPTIAHGFDTKPSVLLPVAARGLGATRVVRTLNGMGNLFSEDTPFTRAARPLYHAAQRWVKSRTAHLVFQNEEDRRHFESRGLAPVGRTSLIHGSGIAEDRFGAVPCATAVADLRRDLALGDDPVVLLVSRLVRNKGIADYLEAARAVRARRPRTRFLLVGPREGEGAQAVERSLLDSHADDVLVLGPRSDVDVILAAADLFVLPSYYREGVPRALLEAAASGLPLVAADTPGCRDVLRGGGVGLLVPPREPAALANAIGTVLDDASGWRERAAKARPEVLRKFGLEAVAARHVALYRTLVGAPS